MASGDFAGDLRTNMHTAYAAGRMRRQMELGVHLARGDDIFAIGRVLEKARNSARHAGNVARMDEALMFEDFIGSLTNNKYSTGHRPGYYTKGIRLFETDVGAVYDKNLSEGFANYVEMRYDDSARGRMRYKLAQRMFPATTRRFGEILDEIGDGEHAYESGRDYGAENKLASGRKRNN